MSTIRTTILLATFIGSTALCATNSVLAQQTYPYSHSAPPTTSRYVQRYSIPVDDLSGHEIVIYELQRTYATDQPTIMGLKILETWGYGIADQINGVGTTDGYNVWKLEDGSKLFSEFHGTVHGELTETGFRKGTYHGTSRFVGGTGKFAAIRGTLTDDVEYYTDPKLGYNRPVSRGEYWFLK